MAKAIRIRQRMTTMRRDTLRMLIAAAVFAVVYVAYLAWQDRATERYLEGLRQNDPVRYLDDIRRTEGFDSFLDKYRLLEGFAALNEAAPNFLIGRWTMLAQPQRVPTGTVFSECRDPITFEHGLIGVGAGTDRKQYQARFRISNGSVWAAGPDFGSLRIVVVAYGSAIDHLELTPPGADAPQYAYTCGS